MLGTGWTVRDRGSILVVSPWYLWVLVDQSCPILCDPVNYSPPGSARILEWVAIPSSRGSYQPRDRTQVSCIAGRCFTTV